MSCSTTTIPPTTVALPVGPQTTTAKETIGTPDHLARIRENQRRSRARKREYVADLETKVRSCQEEGLQLNIQIQRTARRVVEENRKLRDLLSNVGVDESVVEAWLKSNEGGESESGPARTKEVDDILKAKHPCNTCGTAPAKKVNDGQPPAGSQIPVVQDTTSRTATASQLPRNVSIRNVSLLDTSAPVSAGNMYNQQLPVAPITAPSMQSKTAAQVASSSQAQSIPIDFTAYFQSGGIDDMTLPQPYYAQPHPASIYSTASVSAVPDSSEGSSYGTSAAFTPSQLNDPSGITIQHPDEIVSYDSGSLADQLERSISNLEASYSLRRENSYKLDLVQFSIKLWERFVKASAAESGGHGDIPLSRIDTRQLMSVLEEIIKL
ncbi:hypothetical protein V1525DRAFT_401334 [Lipomyces kononenkoae]|uniref:Uncharacterized protein n=1 Tax=Lipomyces kononenkoae TaxID=34357 RepID=A0ACC3T3R6_LIPKO